MDDAGECARRTDRAGVDVAGVALIAIGLLLTTLRYLAQVRGQATAAYQRFRQGLGRTLLLGLEFLVAADVIRTVAITPTFQSVGILAIIVAIRTFLSWSLELELEGHWPWQRTQPGAPADTTSPAALRSRRRPPAAGDSADADRAEG